MLACLATIIGEHSEPSVGMWMEDFAWLCMFERDIYVGIYMCRMFISWECTEDSTDSTLG